MEYATCYPDRLFACEAIQTRVNWRLAVALLFNLLLWIGLARVLLG